MSSFNRFPSSEVRKAREELASIATHTDIRKLARDSDISPPTIYKLIDLEGEPDYRPNRGTWTRLKEFLAKEGRSSKAASRGRETGTYSAGSGITKFGTRAQQIILQYLRRLEAAGLEASELAVMEHLFTDSQFSQRFAQLRGGKLDDDDEILLIEDTWKTISATLALRGVRP